jgi:methyl-accepting chemotaxis protein
MRSLKRRFILLFVLFIFLTCAVITTISIQQNIKTASDIFAAQGIVIIEKAAALVDGDAFERLVHSRDTNDPFYEETRRALLGLKENTSCVYLYTMAPLEASEWIFVIDGSAPPGDDNFSALGDTDDTSLYDDAFFQTWENKVITAGDLADQEDWGWLVSIYAPIFNSAQVPVGIVGCDFQADYLFSSLRGQIIRQLSISFISLLTGFVLLFVFLRMIFGRLQVFNVILKEISEGEGDLTKRLKIRHPDEIGELGVYFNRTLDKIMDLVVNIKKQTADLYNVGSELVGHMGQTASAMEQITASIRTIKGKVMNQAASVNQTNITVDHVTANIGRLSKNVEDQTDSISQSSSAIEEMLANIQSVSSTLTQNAKNVEELISASGAGRTGLETVSKDIREITRESEGILEINAVMQNIASQTNLLSMNAAIEAAHAGEAGKGFAVVADEIRKLAENSGKQSKIISGVLKEIKESIDLITGSTNTVLEKFQAIDSEVRIVSDQEAHIRSAMEEQGQGSQQVLGAVGRMNELTRHVRDGSEEMFQGSQELIQESRNLEALTEEISSSVEEMAAGTEQINNAVSRVNEITNSIKEHIDILAEKVSKFKVE